MANSGPPGHPREAAHDPTVSGIVNDWWSDSPYSPVGRQLLAAAIELFAEQGYHAAKTRDITARIGMSTGAMYAHFRSKEDLLFEISLTGHRTGVATLEAAAADATDPADQLARMVRAFSVYHARYHMIAKIVHYELYGMTPQHLKQILELRRHTTRLIEDVIRHGVDSDAFTAPNVTATGRAVLSLCVDVARWYREHSGETPEQIGDLNAQLALRMLGAREVACDPQARTLTQSSRGRSLAPGHEVIAQHRLPARHEGVFARAVQAQRGCAHCC